MKTRAEQIKAGKIWRAYYDKTPDDVLFEGSKTACMKYLREHDFMVWYKKGIVRICQMVFEFTLAEVCKKSKTVDRFIRVVQGSPELLKAVYRWQDETPERAAKYKDTGWFGIAASYYAENKQHD